MRPKEGLIAAAGIATATGLATVAAYDAGAAVETQRAQIQTATAIELENRAGTVLSQDLFDSATLYTGEEIFYYHPERLASTNDTQGIISTQSEETTFQRAVGSDESQQLPQYDQPVDYHGISISPDTLSSVSELGLPALIIGIPLTLTLALAAAAAVGEPQNPKQLTPTT